MDAQFAALLCEMHNTTEEKKARKKIVRRDEPSQQPRFTASNITLDVPSNVLVALHTRAESHQGRIELF